MPCLLRLPPELIDGILKELPRFDYLKFLVTISNRYRQYFAAEIEKELAVEIGQCVGTKNCAAADLCKVLEGWNTDNLDYEIHHCRIDAINSPRGWHYNNWFSPDFITDGSYILLGSGFEETSLIVFDIAKAQKTTICVSRLNEYGWPGQDSNLFVMAYHSGLLVLGEHNRSPVYFELSGSPLCLTRLDPPEQSSLLNVRAHNVAINREYICVELATHYDKPDLLLLYSRDFVLKGTTTTPFLTRLYIRGKTIVGLTDRGLSTEFWQIEDTDDSGTSIVHFKSIINPELIDKSGILELSLSHNSSTAIVHDGFRFYSETKKIAEFNSTYAERVNSQLGCIDMLAAQYFAVYNAVSTETEKIITFEISNIRFLEEVKRVKVSVPVTLGALLDCQMYFTTIVLFFASGIARLRLKDLESIAISQKAISNSSSLLVRTRTKEERQDLPEDVVRTTW